MDIKESNMYFVYSLEKSMGLLILDEPDCPKWRQIVWIANLVGAVVV